MTVKALPMLVRKETRERAYGSAETTNNDSSLARVVVCRRAGSKAHKIRGGSGPNDCLPFGEAGSEFIFNFQSESQGMLRDRKGAKRGENEWYLEVRQQAQGQ